MKKNVEGTEPGSIAAEDEKYPVPDTSTQVIQELEQIKAKWAEKLSDLNKLKTYSQALRDSGKTVEADSYEQKINELQSAVEILQVQHFQKVLQNKAAFEDWLSKQYNILIMHNVFYDLNQFMDLTECACQDSQFDRRYGRRQASEKLIVETLLKQYPLDDEFCLNYLSLGCYGLLQDFIIIGKLIANGYKKFNIELVDPYFDMFGGMGKITKRFEIFKQLLNVVKETYNVDLNISFQNQAFHEIKKDTILDKPFHCINVIDYDEFKDQSPLRSFVEAHKRLDDKGICLLSVKNYDLLLGKRKCIQKAFHIYNDSEILLRGVVEEVTKFIGTSLIQLLSGKDSIQYSSMGGEFFYQFSEMIEILPLFEFGKALALNLTLNNCLGSGAAPEDYAYFLQLFTAADTTVNVSLVESLDKFLEDKTSDRQDLGTVIGESCHSLGSTHALLRKYATLAAIKGGHQIFGARLLENAQLHRDGAPFLLWSQNLWDKSTWTVPESEEKIIKPAIDKLELGISPYILMRPNYKPDSDIKPLKNNFVKIAVPNPDPLPVVAESTCKCTIS